MHSDSDSSDGEEGGSVQKVINCEEWFVRLTGYSESDWRRKSDKGIRQAEDGSLIITNLKNKKTFKRARKKNLHRLTCLWNVTAAITRVHAAFYDPTKPQGEWTQTATRQVNFLADLRKHFPTHNGYVVLTGREPSFPKVGSAKYDRLFGKVLVGYHHNVQVTTGHRHRGFDVVDDPKQVVDQVFCAALNIGQGMSGMTNKRVSHSQEKCQFILDSDYEATYLSAIKHKRKHLVLTLIGGGVFGNSKQGIYEAILKAHKKWANHPASQLEKVSIVLFSDRDFMTSFPSILKQQNVPFSNGIKMWFFWRNSIPRDIQIGQPNPSSWGKPYANFQFGSNCPSSHFYNHQIIINLTFCGTWAGDSWVWKNTGCGQYASCQNFVQHNPQAFADAYWQINSLKVYQWQ
ncbi:uncharacterized protein ACA1_397280 [Acanthamoeba castellanii str. Neff]|uniref:Uncharacterized protein n=1 Tax=Acanthamoeba castellanii (strain ATCC 30010 / Neff) TaxID=1257118 RepID=L8HCB5_ACACF|nr:uncharacterized protein ACA1_397280 [Acanthamoeba castellanii str. Neff]ELR22882.1 hypothetical protein ACA1_397280 [Acanthamoeba castellanii str. Neff]